MASSTAEIAKVLRDLEHTSAEPATAKMLLQALPHIFGGERHEFQVRLANMLRETLKQASQKQTEMQATAATGMEDITATKGRLQEEKSEAESNEGQAKMIVEEKASALSEKQQLTKAELKRHRDTELKNELVEKEQMELEESKNGIDSIVNGSLNMLLNGSWDSQEGCDDFVKPLMDYLEEMGCDKVLLAALPKALCCCPEKRGEFATFAVDETVKRLNDKVASITTSLEESTGRFDESKAETLGAWAIAEVAKDEEALSEDAKNAADQTLQEATVAVKLALSRVNDIQMHVERITAEQELLEAKIKEIEAATGEMDRLENEIMEADKENADIASPAAKRIKLTEGENNAALQEENACAVGVQ